ncbi:response regulator [Undibacterium sp.]|uniref:response regulator n=1 Tax=Undibacterium sp. TaxID=1914977 RepID=UPI003752100B
MPNSPTEILIIEDEPDLASLIADYVRACGYQSLVLANGQSALEQIQLREPNLIVLDLMLPGLDGISLCRAVRTFSQVPIIMVTAKVEEIDRLLGLEIGADDYLCKPFSPRELMARIKVILRRVSTTTVTTMQSEKQNVVHIDTAAFQIYLHQQLLELTRSEFLLLQHFIAHPGQVFSRSQLLDFVTQDNLDVTDRAIDSHVKNIRKKIAQIRPDDNPIHAIYGLGYRFDGFGN